MTGPLYDVLPPPDASRDEILGRFLDYVAALVPEEDEARV